MLELREIIFWIFSFGLICSALLVVTTRRPVWSVLALVSAFVCAAALWVMQGAEFLGVSSHFYLCGCGDDIVFICGDDVESRVIDRRAIATLCLTFFFRFGWVFIIFIVAPCLACLRCNTQTVFRAHV